MTTVNAKRGYLTDSASNIIIPHATAGIVDSNTHGVLSVKTCTRTEYDAMYSAGTLDSKTIYCVTDDENITTAIFPLFTAMWQDHIVNHMSWLRADTFSWQSGSIYTTAYEHLEKDITNIDAQTETIGSYTVTYYLALDGHKIVLANQETTVNNIYNETGVAWYYVLDTVNKQFKLPRTKFGFTGLRDNVGDFVPAGLPNISGNFSIGSATIDRVSGAFTASGTSNPQGGSVQVASNTASFNASSSNAIYGNSTTVQPNATQMYLYFYVADAVSDPANIDLVSALSAKANCDLDNLTVSGETRFYSKANTNLDNLTDAGKIVGASLGVPSATHENLTWGASGTEYTMPADGYIYIYCGISTGQYVSFFNVTKGYLYSFAPSGTNAIEGLVPVGKGDKVSVTYTVSYSPSNFEFIYAQGNISEAE